MSRAPTGPLSILNFVDVAPPQDLIPLVIDFLVGVLGDQGICPSGFAFDQGSGVNVYMPRGPLPGRSACWMLRTDQLDVECLRTSCSLPSSTRSARRSCRSCRHHLVTASSFAGYQSMPAVEHAPGFGGPPFAPLSPLLILGTVSQLKSFCLGA